MCGLAGYVGPKLVPQGQLQTCLKQLNNRGPDDRGIFEASTNEVKVGLLHTRLSILDLNNRSSQPFHLDRYVFSYNGEIYNYKELRSELKALGHKFYTSGDTEVMSKAWVEWGKAALNKFDGMWVIAVYDKISQTLTLSTDPFGEKPLYLLKDKQGSVYFASQINCLMSLG